MIQAQPACLQDGSDSQGLGCQGKLTLVLVVSDAAAATIDGCCRLDEGGDADVAIACLTCKEAICIGGVPTTHNSGRLACESLQDG